jgi:hypothetical protein
MDTPINDILPNRSFEQRMASYRNRIRAKLQAAGVTDDELDRRTDELMNRRTEFDLTILHNND